MVYYELFIINLLCVGCNPFWVYLTQHMVHVGEVLRGKTARGRWNKQNAIVGLAKCDLMTNLSTAMLSVPQWLALPHLPPSKRCSSSNIQKQLSNKTDQKQRKDRKKREERNRVSRRKDCSVGSGGAKSMISPRRRLEGIEEKRE